MHLHALTQGVLLGLTLSILVGPAFFSLIQTSLTKGLRAGIHFAAGVSLSDIFMASIAWYGLSTLMETPIFRKIFTIVGGAALITIGIYTMFSKHVSHSAKGIPIEIHSRFPIKHTIKGFVANVVNPAIWIYWLVPVSIASSYEGTNMQLIFLTGILGTTLAIDVLKCFIASELKRFMTDRVINLVNKIVGAILMFFGCYLILSLWLQIPVPHSLP